jgi:hypothetical protein
MGDSLLGLANNHAINRTMNDSHIHPLDISGTNQLGTHGTGGGLLDQTQEDGTHAEHNFAEPVADFSYVENSMTGTRTKKIKPRITRRFDGGDLDMVREINERMSQDMESKARLQ